MTIADGHRRGKANRRRFLHALVFLSLIGLQVHYAFERGPRDGVDAGWYIGYALSILHEGQLPRGPAEIVPLYPLWLTVLMRIDPDYRNYLQCPRFNIDYWSGGKKFEDGDRNLCRPLLLNNVGFHVQVLLGAVGTGLVWLAGRLVSGRPTVAHLSAFFAVYAVELFPVDGHVPEGLVIPLFAGVNVCLAWLVLSGARRRGGQGREPRPWRSRLAFCPFFIPAVNAPVSIGLPRYSLGLLMPLSVGAALPVAWAVEGAWNGMPRLWKRAPAPGGGSPP